MAVAVRLFAWLIALVWVGKLAECLVGLRRVANLLGPQYDVEPAGSPRVTVIVPARDEAENVRACLKSLIGQDYGNLRIMAVDDRSNDETGAILRALAEAHRERMEMMSVVELPPGWLGKTHAMATAARRAIEQDRPQYLLFTDADIIFRADAIRRAVAQAVAEDADHFVLLPTTIVKAAGEGMLLAYLQVMSLWAVRPWRVADARARRDAIGVGAFNMIRTSAYERLGGFEAAPMEILEDLDLGRRVKRAGLRQRVATGPGMVSVHWAAGALGIVTGMTKNLFAMFRFRPERILAGALWTGIFCLGPVVMLGFALTQVAGVVALAAVAGFYVLSGRTSRISWGYALGFPIAVIAVMYSMFRSMAVTVVHGGVSWRGTFYTLKDLREHDRKKH
jgi:cellulose synthase/poly-beta-1,6-N-acetylglucosamine synthase-like glycosyltransferase